MFEKLFGQEANGKQINSNEKYDTCVCVKNLVLLKQMQNFWIIQQKLLSFCSRFYFHQFAADIHKIPIDVFVQQNRKKNRLMEEREGEREKQREQ